MKQTDNYKILATTTELLNKHMDLKAIEKSKDVPTALKAAYQTAEHELLAYIKQVVAPIKTIPDLTATFSAACYGIGALGMRQDLIHKKLLGNPKSGECALLEAIDKDLIDNQLPDVSMPDYVEMGFCNNAFTLCTDAFSDYLQLINKNDNVYALCSMYLLHYTVEHDVDLDLAIVMQNTDATMSCLRTITGSEWANRALTGYFDENGQWIRSINTEFVGTFGRALREIFNRDKNYFDVMQAKQMLHKQIVSVYAVINSPLELYGTVDRLIDANKTPQGLTQEIIDECNIAFAVTRRYDNSGVSYKLNTEGLQSLAYTLTALELDGLQEVNVIIDRIKAACA
jgi:hypothetical protein